MYTYLHNIIVVHKNKDILATPISVNVVQSKWGGKLYSMFSIPKY